MARANSDVLQVGFSENAFHDVDPKDAQAITKIGVAIARNELLPHAQGRYIVQLDSDDWLEPDYLESVAADLSRPARELAGDPRLDTSRP